MKGHKFKVEEIIRILGEASLPNTSVSSICRKYGISPNTFYKWKRKYSNLKGDEAVRLKVLEDENLRLKRLLAEKEMEIQLLKDILNKNF